MDTEHLLSKKFVFVIYQNTPWHSIPFTIQNNFLSNCLKLQFVFFKSNIFCFHPQNNVG